MILFVIAAVQTTKFDHFGVLYVILMVAFYWTTQVFKHVLHAIVAETIGQAYFCGSDWTAEMGARATIRAVKRYA